MKIKIIPNDNHSEEVKKLYNKTFKPAKYIVVIDTPIGKVNLEKEEWEEV